MHASTQSVQPVHSSRPTFALTFRPPLEYVITCSTHMYKQFHTLELAMVQLYIFIVNLLIPEDTKVL